MAPLVAAAQATSRLLVSFCQLSPPTPLFSTQYTTSSGSAYFAALLPFLIRLQVSVRLFELVYNYYFPLLSFLGAILSAAASSRKSISTILPSIFV